MRSASSFEYAGDLVLVKCKLLGPNGYERAKLILDTGSALTTITQRIATRIGYSRADSLRTTFTRSAVGKERGYLIRVPEIEALQWALSDHDVNVADLGYDIDGLLGMNFLRHFNFEIRPAERRILVETVDP